MLRARFGNENQTERFRAELRARRRAAGESLQAVYNDICRLLALAYPGPSNPTTAIVGRDAFIDALNHQQMRVRILEREPRTLEEALSIASRLEAYDRTAPAAVAVEAFDDERGKTRSRHVRNIQAPVPSFNNDAAVEKLSKQVAELTQAFAR